MDSNYNLLTFQEFMNERESDEYAPPKYLIKPDAEEEMYYYIKNKLKTKTKVEDYYVENLDD